MSNIVKGLTWFKCVLNSAVNWPVPLIRLVGIFLKGCPWQACKQALYNVTAQEKRRQGRSIMLIHNLEYQDEEARGLASEALNTGFRACARLAEITWHGRCNN